MTFNRYEMVTKLYSLFWINKTLVSEHLLTEHQYSNDIMRTENTSCKKISQYSNNIPWVYLRCSNAPDIRGIFRQHPKTILHFLPGYKSASLKWIIMKVYKALFVHALPFSKKGKNNFLLNIRVFHKHSHVIIPRTFEFTWVGFVWAKKFTSENSGFNKHLGNKTF